MSLREAALQSFRLRSRLRPVLAALCLLALAASPLERVRAVDAELEIRVVDEVAPAGGLALIRVELTEPKPVSGGQMRFFLAANQLAPGPAREAAHAGPIGSIVAADFLSRTGDVTGSVFFGQDEAIFHFVSPQSSFGTESDLPIMVVAVSVDPNAVPGTGVSLQLDLGASRFLDPNGVPYTVDVKPGRFTVGGVSITKLVAPDRVVPSGTDLVFEGVGFRQGARLDVEGAELSSTRFVNSRQVEVTARSTFSLKGARIRLRNPDDSEDFFYAIPALVESSLNRNVTVRFATPGLTLVRGQSRDVTVQLSPAAAADGALRLQASDANVLLAPASIPIKTGATSATVRVFGAATGASDLLASLAGPAASLPVTVVDGSVLRIPVLRNDAASLLGLALANRQQAIADVELRGYPAGTAAGGAASIALTFPLEPMRQVSRFLAEYDSRFAGFRGWVQVSSRSTDLHSLFLSMPTDRVAFAGSSGSSPTASDFIFPQTGLDPQGSFEVAVVNNNFREALLSLDLTDASGGVVQRLQRILAPQDSLLATLRELFPGVQGAFAGRYLRIASTRPVTAYQQVENGPRIIAHSPPTPERSSGRLSLPQFASGEGWFTEISLVNARATAEAAVLLRLVDDDGSVIAADVALNPARVTIPAGGMVVVRGRELFGISGTRRVVGSVTVEGAALVVGSAVVGQESPAPIATGVPVYPQPFSEAVFPHLATGVAGGLSYFTGLALHNGNPTGAVTLIRVFSSTGDFKGEANVALPGGGRISKLLTELIPGLEPIVGGHVHVVSTLPVAMIQIYGNDRLDFVTAVPPSIIR